MRYIFPTVYRLVFTGTGYPINQVYSPITIKDDSHAIRSGNDVDARRHDAQ